MMELCTRKDRTFLRRGLMATRESLNELKQQCEDALRFANEQYQESSLQQQYNDDNYTQALQQLEGAYNDIATNGAKC